MRGQHGTLAALSICKVLVKVQQLHLAGTVRLFDFGAGGGNVIAHAIQAFGFRAFGCELCEDKVRASLKAASGSVLFYFLRHPV